MNPGEIYFLITNGMFARQGTGRWMKITNCPQTENNARPFVFIRTGRDDDWGIWAPCRTRRDQHTITVPAREIAYTDNTNIDQNIMYKQLWEIPNAFIPVQNYNHHKINTEYFNTQILPKCKHYIDVILG